MNPSLISPQWLQRAVGVLGLSFPFVLTIFAGERESISAHYHGPARDIFVGWLSMIALALAVYKGYDGTDKKCARVAAIGLLVLTYSPTGPDLWGKLHLVGALTFFFASAALCWRFGRGSRPRTFRLMSCGILACISWAVLAGIFGGSIFAPEAIAVLLFGAGWTLKGKWLERV